MYWRAPVHRQSTVKLQFLILLQGRAGLTFTLNCSLFFSSTESIKRDIILWDFIIFILLDLVNREMSCLPCTILKTLLPDKIRMNTPSASSPCYYHQKLAIGYVLPLEMRSTVSESVTQDVFLVLKDKSQSLILTDNKYSLVYHPVFKR